MMNSLLSIRLGEHRWTQADLARKTGIRANTIGELYHGIARSIQVKHLYLICKALDCDAGDIISCEAPRPQIQKNIQHDTPKDVLEDKAKNAVYESHNASKVFDDELQRQLRNL